MLRGEEGRGERGKGVWMYIRWGYVGIKTGQQTHAFRIWDRRSPSFFLFLEGIDGMIRIGYVACG